MKRILGLGVIITLAFITYAYGFSVTQVDLEELGSPTRRESLTRILRALARPDFIEYDKEEFLVETAIYTPCPEEPILSPTPPDSNAPLMVMTPPCADPKTEVTIEGFNFAPNTSGPLNFIPPSGASLQMGSIETDGNGHFELTFKMRDRPSEEPQLLRAITRRSIGSPHLSQNGVDTIDKIIETVFMALLATTLGTILAVPISFFAAQNLMRTVTSPLPTIALSIIGAPIGIGIGSTIANNLSNVSLLLTTNLVLNIGSLILVILFIWGIVRWSLQPDESLTSQKVATIIPLIRLLFIVLATLLFLYLLSDFAISIGLWLVPVLGIFGFIGTFIANLGEILKIALMPISALIGAGVLVSFAGRLGQRLVEKLSGSTGKVINLVLAGLAGAILFVLVGMAIDWLYQIQNHAITLYWPAAIGAIAGLFVAFRTHYNKSLPVGIAIYSVTRTVLNALRSVEALIMVIVFAVWVGIGPFAGVLALGLHTVAALAKLYSEQVEGIMDGPLEAVLATGANRLQMIVYAVIPQIVPPYISFTMYRWDINVRMSTIIGFAGGGGIGFLLQQNINLLNYRAASAQILAIAIVVSLMDYLSSTLRQRTI